MVYGAETVALATDSAGDIGYVATIVGIRSDGTFGAMPGVGINLVHKGDVPSVGSAAEAVAEVISSIVGGIADAMGALGGGTSGKSQTMALPRTTATRSAGTPQGSFASVEAPGR